MKMKKRIKILNENKNKNYKQYPYKYIYAYNKSSRLDISDQCKHYRQVDINSIWRKIWHICCSCEANMEMVAFLLQQVTANSALIAKLKSKHLVKRVNIYSGLIAILKTAANCVNE